MASHIEREMCQDDEESNKYLVQNEVVFHVSLAKESIEQIHFVYNLIKPIFRSYYDLVRFLAATNGTCLKMEQISNSSGYSMDRVKRVCAKLRDIGALLACQDHQDCIRLLNCDSLSGLLPHIGAFIM